MARRPVRLPQLIPTARLPAVVALALRLQHPRPVASGNHPAAMALRINHRNSTVGPRPAAEATVHRPHNPPPTARLLPAAATANRKVASANRKAASADHPRNMGHPVVSVPRKISRTAAEQWFPWAVAVVAAVQSAPSATR